MCFDEENPRNPLLETAFDENMAYELVKIFRNAVIDFSNDIFLLQMMSDNNDSLEGGKQIMFIVLECRNDEAVERGA